jgi:twinkle protein
MIISPLSIKSKVSELYQKGFARGHDTGWPVLDEHFSVKAGELTVITGTPSHGKSHWLDSLLVNLALNHNYRTLIFSPENYPLELHASRILEKINQQPFFGYNRMSTDDMDTGMDFLDKHFKFIVPDETQFTPTDIVNEAAQHMQSAFWTGISFPLAVVIDPWNEMDHYRPSSLTETEYISRILTEIRRFAREFKCHLFLVAHPQKLRRGTDGSYPVPTPYDIAGSAHFYNKPDNIITVWRDVMNAPTITQIHVQKVRFNSTGHPGMVELSYNKEKSSYGEAPRSELLR